MMRLLRPFRRSLLLGTALWAALWAGCSDGDGGCPRGQPVISARALDDTSVELVFACEVDQNSASAASSYEIADYTLTPPVALSVHGASASGSRVQLTTASQTALVTYTVKLRGVADQTGNRLAGSVNFVGVGQANAAQITLVVDDRYHANLTAVTLLASFDPLTGVFTHFNSRVPLTDADGDHIFEATVPVAVDPARTLDTADDRLGSQFMAYSVRAVDDEDRPLSELVLFEVASAAPQRIEVPLLNVPAPPPPEGVIEVTFVVDDRPARALRDPHLRGSFDAQGTFDADFPTTILLSDQDGDAVWEGSAKVRIAPDRILSGKSPETQPYSVYLVEGETPYSARSADFTVPDEQPLTVSILMGNPDLVPVTFSVDVGQSWLVPDGSARGVFPGEAVFLTGEFGIAEDAFGQNATDAFSGGENTVLQMSERTDRPGLWQRTIFLPKNRPYGWKVVRCPKDKGCSQLNKKVSSSGRAFPTVMKNLITELCDASKSSWSDSNCQSPRLIDPRDLGQVDTGAGVLDYRNAAIFEGSGAGLADQQDPSGTPSAELMFKQEAPDLVVDVEDQPLATPAYVVGTWRDVNIPGTPADLLAGDTIIDLSKTDYDAGMVGVLPPSYAPPALPQPSPFTMDGQLDSQAQLVAGGSGTMSLYLALSGSNLYLATEDAGEGSDHFLFISASAPGALRPAPWGKAGQVAFAGKTLFMADENDGPFAGWFQLGSPDTLLQEQGGSGDPALAIATAPQNGGMLEGVIDLEAVFGALPSSIYLAVAPWGSGDGGPLYSSGQTPATQDSNSNIEANEIAEVSLPSLEVNP